MPGGVGHVQKLFLRLPGSNKAGNENSREAEGEKCQAGGSVELSGIMGWRRGMQKLAVHGSAEQVKSTSELERRGRSLVLFPPLSFQLSSSFMTSIFYPVPFSDEAPSGFLIP